jgi:hypothetical protein
MVVVPDPVVLPWEKETNVPGGTVLGVDCPPLVFADDPNSPPVTDAGWGGEDGQVDDPHHGEAIDEALVTPAAVLQFQNVDLGLP